MQASRRKDTMKEQPRTSTCDVMREGALFFFSSTLKEQRRQVPVAAHPTPDLLTFGQRLGRCVNILEMLSFHPGPPPHPPHPQQQQQNWPSGPSKPPPPVSLHTPDVWMPGEVADCKMPRL